jgi:uncharacterized protein (DUF58 family)
VQALWVGLLAAVVAVTSAAAPVTSERIAGSLRLEAVIPARAFAAGTSVPITLSVHNRASAPVTISFASGQRYDAIARRPRGDEVWRWSHDKAFVQNVQMVVLKPGEELSYRMNWDQQDLQGRQVDPGTYEIVVIFMGQPETDRGQGIALPPLLITITP